MPIELGGTIYYYPEEVAQRLEISTKKLQYHRLAGDIKGTAISSTLTLYTDEQIANARIERKKPGPKPSPHTKRRKKTKQASDDEPGPSVSPVMCRTSSSMCRFALQAAS